MATSKIDRWVHYLCEADRPFHLPIGGQRIELVKEDDARFRLSRLLEHLANVALALADIHVDELGALEERRKR